MSLYFNIAKYIKLKGWRIADFARKTGIAANNFSELKNGRKKGINSEQIEKIIRNSDIEPYFLLTGEGPIIKQHSQNPTYEDISLAVLLIEKGLRNRWISPENKGKLTATIAQLIQESRDEMSEDEIKLYIKGLIEGSIREMEGKETDKKQVS